MTSKIRLRKGERVFLKKFVHTGKKTAREIARANILLMADRGQKTENIAQATETNRQTVWKVKKRYLKEGLCSALKEKPRSGQPIKYDKKKNTEIIAKACTAAPIGSKRWSVRLLTEEFVGKKGFETINRESVRLILKKAGRSLG